MRPRAARLDHQVIESCNGKGQVGAALVVDDSVNLIQDHCPDRRERRPAAFRGEQDEQRLRRGHKDVRRLFQHALPLPRRRIASPHGHAHRRYQQTFLARKGGNLCKRPFEVLLNVVA